MQFSIPPDGGTIEKIGMALLIVGIAQAVAFTNPL
jgi:hypothetical protein